MQGKEIDIFHDFIRAKGLRYTSQRERILRIFLSTERHVSAEELFKIVKKKDPQVGYTTVYRTMRLLSDSGLSGEVDFGDGIHRFEHKYGHVHHDHLICVKCGRYTEVFEPKIERLQDELAKRHRFTPNRHKLQIFGVCRQCSP